MKFVLGVTTCDKCQEPMIKEQAILVIAETNAIRSDDDITAEGLSVYYACHRDCWDGFAEID